VVSTKSVFSFEYTAVKISERLQNHYRIERFGKPAFLSKM